MSLDLGDGLVSDDTKNDVKKKSSLPGKIFSIENLLRNGSKSETTENEKEMSTRGSSDGEEEDDISEQDDVEICKSNGDQIFLRIHSYIILDFYYLHRSLTLESFIRHNHPIFY